MRKYIVIAVLLSFALMLIGCGGFDASGVVTNGSGGQGIPGVTVVARGDCYAETVTDARGKWYLMGLSGTVDITASKEGWTFATAWNGINKNHPGLDTLDFVGVQESAENYTASGRITNGSDGLHGVKVTFSGGYTPEYTDELGYWEKPGLSGTITVTPVRQGWEFSPVSQEITYPAREISFIGTYTAAGRVTRANDASTGVEGVTVNIDGFGSVMTDAEGYWSKSGLSGTVTITPQKEGLIFYPGTYQVDGPSLGRDFESSFNVWFSLSINPSSTYTPDNPDYYVSCNIDRKIGETGTTFSDAIITVNGTTLQYVSQLGSFRASGLHLKTGDAVTVTMSHSTFGSVTKTLSVPESVTIVTTVPDIGQWIGGQVEEITINWNATTSNGYRCWCNGYDSSEQFLGGYSGISETNTETFGHGYLNFDSGQATYAEFVVDALCWTRLEGFYGSSAIEVYAPYQASISNLPAAAPVSPRKTALRQSQTENRITIDQE